MFGNLKKRSIFAPALKDIPGLKKWEDGEKGKKVQKISDKHCEVKKMLYICTRFQKKVTF